ncbi:DUF6711 family protein [Clostridium baratii]|uniref:DUF6711 family protein n=1 Tax=Clostridium baratii TaxID=1561 RepID=UPI0030CF9CAC
MLKINGVAVATPKSLQVDIADLDGESNRNLKGLLIRDRIDVKRKLNLEWGLLSVAECSKLLKAVSSVFFQVEFFDPQEGRFITKTMYVGDRNIPVQSYIKGVMKWEGLKMNFIER